MNDQFFFILAILVLSFVLIISCSIGLLIFSMLW